VDGSVEGDVESDGDVIVGAGGYVRGDVTAVHVIVAGRIGGNAVASRQVELLAGGQIAGDIKTPKLVMNDGIAFDGRVAAGLERRHAGKNR